MVDTHDDHSDGEDSRESSASSSLGSVASHVRGGKRYKSLEREAVVQKYAPMVGHTMKLVKRMGRGERRWSPDSGRGDDGRGMEKTERRK